MFPSIKGNVLPNQKVLSVMRQSVNSKILVLMKVHISFCLLRIIVRSWLCPEGAYGYPAIFS